MGQCVIMTGGYAGDSSDDCTATKSQVLEGYKAITKDSDDNAVLGTIPNKGAWTNRLGVNGKAIIPAGYHNGSGYVDQAITNRGAWGTSIGVNGNITIPEGYHNGQGHVMQSIATLGGQTITPSASQQTVACSGKYMTGNVVVNPIPTNYVRKVYQKVSIKQTITVASQEYIELDLPMFTTGFTNNLINLSLRINSIKLTRGGAFAFSGSVNFINNEGFSYWTSDNNWNVIITLAYSSTGVYFGIQNNDKYSYSITFNDSRANYMALYRI